MCALGCFLRSVKLIGKTKNNGQSTEVSPKVINVNYSSTFERFISFFFNKGRSEKESKGEESRNPHVRNGIISTSEKAFKRKAFKTVKFSKDDMANVKAKIRHYKKEYKRKTLKEREQEREQ